MFKLPFNLRRKFSSPLIRQSKTLPPENSVQKHSYSPLFATSESIEALDLQVEDLFQGTSNFTGRRSQDRESIRSSRTSSSSDSTEEPSLRTPVKSNEDLQDRMRIRSYDEIHPAFLQSQQYDAFQNALSIGQVPGTKCNTVICRRPEVTTFNSYAQHTSKALVAEVVDIPVSLIRIGSGDTLGSISGLALSADPEPMELHLPDGIGEGLPASSEAYIGALREGSSRATALRRTPAQRSVCYRRRSD